MKKIIISLIVVVVIALGAFAILHKSSKPTANSSHTTSQSKVPAVNNAVLVTKTDPSLGQYLAAPNGKPLYTYNADSKGVSNCTGSCLANWPAYVDGSTSNLPAGVGTIKRTDNGKTQYTYNGLPLYYFVSDSPGHVTGDGIENFSVAKPAGTSSSSSNSSGSMNSNDSSNSSSNSDSTPSSPSYNSNY